MSSQVDAYLDEAELARQKQLDALPSTVGDAVTAAYRGSVQAIPDQIRTARQRLKDGLCGICTGCSRQIARARLEARLWTTTCASCAARPSY